MNFQKVNIKMPRLYLLRMTTMDFLQFFRARKEQITIVNSLFLLETYRYKLNELI